MNPVKFLSRTLPFVLCLGLLWPVPALAQEPASDTDADAATTDAPSERETPPAGGEPHDFTLAKKTAFSLDNGLGVTMVPYGQVPKAVVGLVTRTGNIDETAEQLWLADLTADLMAEGAGERDAKALAQAFASLGGELRISVGLDATWVFTETLADHAPEAVALLASVVQNPTLPADELERLAGDRKRRVSISREQPQSKARLIYQRTIFGDHPYGRGFPTEEQLDGYTVDDVKSFHGANFGAERSDVYVIGSFDADAVESAVRDAFGTWAAGPAPTSDVPSPATMRQILVLDRPGAEQTNLRLGLPTIDRSHADWIPLQVTNALLGGSFSSRITRNIREDKGYTYSPGSFVSSNVGVGTWTFTADVTTDVTGPALKEILFEMDRMREEPVPADELEAIQNYMAGTFVLQNSTLFGIFSQLYQLDLHGMDESYLETYVEKVHAVTPAEVQRIAREYLRLDELVIVAVGDRSVIDEQLGHFGELTEASDD